jgi:DtxR family transcriptional regulator, Mn-dependent transcriptional regulator
MIHPPADEVLEQLYYALEEQRAVTSRLDLHVDLSEDTFRDGMATLLTDAAVIDDGTYRLSESGERRARGIVRRHRLAEVLFVQALGSDLHEAEVSACEMEHILSEAVVDRVCAFLGHPPVCPHGKSVPAGTCCVVYPAPVQPLIARVIDLPIGGRASIAFIAPKTLARIERLAAFGIVPGSDIRLIARRPSCVVACGASSIALDDDIAGEIYVRTRTDGDLTRPNRRLRSAGAVS